MKLVSNIVQSRFPDSWPVFSDGLLSFLFDNNQIIHSHKSNNMKVTEVYYKQLFNLGNYQNIEVGIKVAVGENEDPNDAMKFAKQFVIENDPNIDANLNFKAIREAQLIISKPHVFTHSKVKEAMDTLDKLGVEYNKEPLENDLEW